MAEKRKLGKVVILGDSTVGKTSILHQFVDQRFTQQYRATVGADLLAKDVEVDGQRVSLQIWDTAGQERFANLGGSFYKGADLCILTYDITNRTSFEALDNWKHSFLEYGAAEDRDAVPFVLLGNKTDREDRAVTTAEGEEWAEKNGKVKFFEVSALKNTNVTEAFQAVAKLVIERQNLHEEADLGFQTNKAPLRRATQSGADSKSCAC